MSKKNNTYEIKQWIIIFVVVIGLMFLTYVKLGTVSHSSDIEKRLTSAHVGGSDYIVDIERDAKNIDTQSLGKGIGL